MTVMCKIGGGGKPFQMVVDELPQVGEIMTVEDEDGGSPNKVRVRTIVPPGNPLNYWDVPFIGFDSHNRPD